MKEFSSTALQAKPADVFNEVQSEGEAKITHRSRPPMILINESKLSSLINFAQSKGYKVA